ncbi:MAG TPA: helix-turn-helix domain-containing protein, partial [Fimbriimonas sp.]|nr:helix-turn-helix domain-containing protein [Fimbriimonas sp.]
MRKTTATEYAQLIERAIDLMVDQLDSAISFEQIAQEVGVSQFHFGRIFTGAVGESPLAFGRRLRMERAAYQLVNTSLPITEIAFDARYETLEAFIRAFRSAYLTTPSEFRKNPSRVELQCPSQVHWSPEGCSPPSLFNLQGNTMEAKIVHIEPMTVLALRHIGPYNEIGPKFGELMQWAGPNRVPIMAAIAIYH